MPHTSSPALVTHPTKAKRGQFTARVLANRSLCREHFGLVLGLDDFPLTRPGQFIQISGRNGSIDYSVETEIDWAMDRPLNLGTAELQSPLALLRRPFSLAGRCDVESGVELEIIHRVVGAATDWMSRLSVGDGVDILGPLGNSFELPPADGVALMVGGGVGIPPMMYLAGHLEGRRGVAFAGALTRDLLPFTLDLDASGDSVVPIASVREFSRHGVPAVITTDDGSYGFRGFVTQALEQYLDQQLADAGARELAVIYTCGPEPMMKRVAEIAGDRHIACQIAVERAMACGMGTCQSCCIRVRKPDPSKVPLPGQDWCYRLACTDGPVFRGSDLLW